ncbi:MAG: PepSY domain-containing protein, partial [Allomuricauda sp.]
MGKRTYNILFHTHTVSGIVISVALYVIFFAGSFAFFRDEINNWQRNHKVEVIDELPSNLDAQLEQLSQTYELHGRDVELRHNYNERNIAVSLGASKDSLASEKNKESAFLYLDTTSGHSSTYAESYA